MSRLSAFLAALIALMTIGSAVAVERTIVDAEGRTVTIGDAARIVAIGGAVTEILYALGVEDRIIAVDVTSDFPARARDKASVGYMRTLSPEGVLATNPGLILAIEGSGPKEAIDVLTKASVPFVIVPEAHDAAGVVAKIRFIADVVGEPKRGEELAAAVNADLSKLEAERAKLGAHRRAVFVLSMAGGSPLVAGEGTLADSIFALAGVDNALSGFTGYKPASEEAALAANPDAVVLMAERGRAMTPETIFASPAFAGTPAARDRRLVTLPGSYLLGFGPRTAHAARDLAAGIYPERALPELPARPWTTDAP